MSQNLRKISGVECPYYYWHYIREYHGASILLPENFELERRAVQQLIAFAEASHPNGERVVKTMATPDFHAGSLIANGLENSPKQAPDRAMSLSPHESEQELAYLKSQGLFTI